MMKKKMGEKKQLKTIFDTFDSMVFIWIQDVLLTMKTFVIHFKHTFCLGINIHQGGRSLIS